MVLLFLVGCVCGIELFDGETWTRTNELPERSLAYKNVFEESWGFDSM